MDLRRWIWISVSLIFLLTACDPAPPGQDPFVSSTNPVYLKKPAGQAPGALITRRIKDKRDLFDLMVKKNFDDDIEIEILKNGEKQYRYVYTPTQAQFEPVISYVGWHPPTEQFIFTVEDRVAGTYGQEQHRYLLILRDRFPNVLIDELQACCDVLYEDGARYILVNNQIYDLTQKDWKNPKLKIPNLIAARQLNNSHFLMIFDHDANAPNAFLVNSEGEPIHAFSCNRETQGLSPCVQVVMNAENNSFYLIDQDYQKELEFFPADGFAMNRFYELPSYQKQMNASFTWRDSLRQWPQQFGLPQQSLPDGYVPKIKDDLVKPKNESNQRWEPMFSPEHFLGDSL